MANKTCKDCIHFKICNDYVYLIGREDNIACPDFKSTADVVPRSELEKIFEEIEQEAYKNEEGDMYLDLPDYLIIKNKHIGEKK